MAASVWRSRTKMARVGLTWEEPSSGWGVKALGWGQMGSWGQELQISGFSVMTRISQFYTTGGEMESCTFNVCAFLRLCRGFPKKLRRRLSPNFQGEAWYSKVSWSWWRDRKRWLGALQVSAGGCQDFCLYLCFVCASSVWQGGGGS